MTISVCVAGATGWTGAAVARGVLDSSDLVLVSAVSRSAAGRDLGTAWSEEPAGVPVFGTVEEALDGVDVLVDYTSASVAAANVSCAVRRGVHAVVGSSGLTHDQLEALGADAARAGVGIIASGNFSTTGAVLQLAALSAARLLSKWEIIDYAAADKPDAPSGTARELAERLGAIGSPPLDVAIDDTIGPVETRGATLGGTQVHSVRLPGYLLSTEVVFGAPGERLTMRLDAGDSAQPYVGGTLLAVREVMARPGLTRGLDILLGEQLRHAHPPSA